MAEALASFEYDTFNSSAVPLSATQDIIIRAREVFLDADIRLPGRTLAIYADEVNGSGKMMDLSGGPPSQNFTPGQRGVDGASTAQPGAPGRPGSPGQPAGSLRIYARRISGNMKIILQGGPGGRGEDGGNGAPGAPGSGGGVNVAGGQGGPGGTGGPAGPSGIGGKGGMLEIGTVEPLDAALTSAFQNTVVSGGIGGPAATPGVSGPGGAGGPGGPQGHNEERCVSHRGTEDVCHTVFVQTGTMPTGPAGPSPSVPPASAGQNGQAGRVAIGTITFAQIAQGETATHMDLLLSNAELDYLNDQLDVAAKRLAYIVSIARFRVEVSIT
jgi:hypothetical protein